MMGLRDTKDVPVVREQVRVGRMDRQVKGDLRFRRRTGGARFDGRDDALRRAVQEIFVDDVRGPIDLGAERIRDEPAVPRGLEPSNREMGLRLEERGDRLVDHSDAPLLMAEEGPASPPDRVSALLPPEPYHLKVRRGREDRRGAFRRRLIDVTGVALADVFADACGPSGRAEMQLIEVPSPGLEDRGEVSLPKDDAAVEAVRQPLEDGSVHAVSQIDLPEARWHASVLHLVVVVEGPHAVAGRAKDLAADDAECEPQDEIEIVFSDPPDVRVLEILREFSFRLHATADGRDLSQ